MVSRGGPALGPVVSVTDNASDTNRDGIQVDMARTRAELGNTIDAIQERLDPQRLKEQAINSVREATIGKVEHTMSKVEQAARGARYGLVDTVRSNPIPVALVGVGLAWLFFGGADRDESTTGSYPRYQTHGRDGTRPAYGGFQASPMPAVPAVDPGQIKDKAQNLANQAKDQLGNLSGQVQGTVQQVGSQARDQVENLSSQAQEQVAGIQSDVQGQLQSFSTEFQQQTYRMSYSFERAMRENPLSVGAVALALGAAVGLAAPEMPHEDELIGDARVQVRQKAQEAAHQALENVQKMADKVQTGAEEPNKPL